MASQMISSIHNLTGCEVVNQCLDLLEAAREQLQCGQLSTAIAFVQIIREDGEHVLLALGAMFTRLESAVDVGEQLLDDVSHEMASLTADAERLQQSIVGHQDDIQDGEWIKEHLDYLEQEATQKYYAAERAYEENKAEREKVHIGHVIPIFGLMAFYAKNKSCEANMLKHKQAMEEAEKQATNALASRDVMDAAKEEDEVKVLCAQDKSQDCEVKTNELHQLIGDLRLALSVVQRVRHAVEQIKAVADLASSSIETVGRILDMCQTRPDVGRSRGTEMQFNFTGKSWRDVKDMIGKAEELFNHTALNM